MYIRQAPKHQFLHQANKAFLQESFSVFDHLKEIDQIAFVSSISKLQSNWLLFHSTNEDFPRFSAFLPSPDFHYNKIVHQKSSNFQI